MKIVATFILTILVLGVAIVTPSLREQKAFAQQEPDCGSGCGDEDDPIQTGDE